MFYLESVYKQTKTLAHWVLLSRQLDLRFCKNEWSKRSKNNEKGDQQDDKSRRKFIQIASKVSNDRLL